MAHSINSDYTKLLPRYETIRDCLNDDVVMHASKYLVRTDGMSDESYKCLAQLGRYMNITGSTLEAMMGLANRTKPDILLPPDIDYLLTNADGEGNGLETMIKAALSDDTAMGRYGLLVEPPSARIDDNGLLIKSTTADVKSGKVRTTIKPYTAESIVDYEVSVVNDVKQTSLVKLMENIEVRDKETFQIEIETQFRFLILTKDGYEQRLYEDVDGTTMKGLPVAVTGFDGKQLQYIPFYFIGSRNNDAVADNPPFYKLADKNIALYNLDANNRLNLNIYATGTLIVTGDAHDLGKKTITVGGGGGIYLGESGSANILQLQAGTALPEAMAADKADMVELGAKLSQPNVSRTLGEAMITVAQEMALLSTVTDNVEMAFKTAVNQVSLIQTGKDADFELTLNRKFFTKPLTAQERAQWVGEVQMGISPKVLYYKRLRDAGEYPQDWTDKEIEDATDESGGIIE